MSKRFVVMLALFLAIDLGLSLIAVPAAWAASKYKVIYSFSDVRHGSGPHLFDALAIDGKGNLYGTAAGGTGTGCGAAAA